jgi:L-cystine uptake protein TcyP (sodium:dicarboxylate symporter family)
MNLLSFVFIIIFGAAFGFVFKDLLEGAGMKSEASSWIAVIALGFVALAGFVLYPLFYLGIFTLQGLDSFYNSTQFWLTVSLVAGGFARFGISAAMKQAKPQ